MTSYPYWATPEQLGSYPEGYSFTEQNLSIAFGETLNLPVSATLLNGSLPPGISWQQVGYQILLTGFLQSVSADTQYQFTFRLSNGTNIADRTFYVQTLNVSLQSFQWLTDNTNPLLYVYENLVKTATIRAITDPVAPVTYDLVNAPLLSQGISLDSTTGLLTVDIIWKPLTSYVMARDYVTTSDGLYECVISGTSSSVSAPTGSGIHIDTDYEPWQPNRFYEVNRVVHNDQGKIYLCVVLGFSGASGPSGNGSGIVDGSAVWNYIEQAPVWSKVLPDVQIDQSLNVDARSGSQQLFRQFPLFLVSRPSAPLWITPAGSLTPATTESSWSYQLEAADPDLLALSWSSSNLPSWMGLTPTGLLYGVAPLVGENTNYLFDVSVNDGTNISTRSFSVLVVENVIEFSWITASDLGAVPDGVQFDRQVQAVSTRSNIPTYGLSGGMLPVGVILDTQTGALQGFLEYHAQNKTYLFEITADDGTETITRTFTIEVVSQNLGHYWSLSVPLWGPDKDAFQIQNSESIVDYNNLYLPASSGWGRTSSPSVPLIAGIKGINAADLRTLIQPYLHNFVMQMQNFEWLPGRNSAYEILNLQVRDSDSVQIWKSNTAYYKGERVNNLQGERYVALNDGTSGTNMPQGLGTNIVDGGVSWSYDSVPNPITNTRWPLPWYPYHKYVLNDTVVNNGVVYRVIQAGTSGGGVGPTALGDSILDNTVIWQSETANYPYGEGNTFWPDNVYNIRSTLISQVGWSTGSGSQASADVTVDFQGTVTQVTVTNPGTGYYSVPSFNLSGTGTGAELLLRVGITHVTVNNGGVNWSVGDQLVLDLGTGTPALLEVSQVSGIGSVTDMGVVNPGEFTNVPNVPLTLVSNNKVITIVLDAGLISAVVTQGGSGYTPDQTQINFLGREYSVNQETLISNFRLCLPLAKVQSSSVNQMDLDRMFNPFLGQLIDVRAVVAKVQGVVWQGYNRFDDNTLSFDSDATRFVDLQPATETLFDADQTQWESGSTTYDLPYVMWPNYTQTVFDDNHTIFDYYRTIFDQSSPRTDSIYSRSWVWWFGKPWYGAK